MVPCGVICSKDSDWSHGSHDFDASVEVCEPSAHNMILGFVFVPVVHENHSKDGHVEINTRKGGPFKE